METLIIILWAVFLLLVGPMVACWLQRRTEAKVKSALDSSAFYRLLEAQHYVPSIMESLENAESLMELLALHKLIWALGLRNENIGPDQFGYFRTFDILSMTPDEVFLGNFNGYFTHPIPVWEESRASNEDVYQEILSQYRKHLISNLKEISDRIY